MTSKPLLTLLVLLATLASIVTVPQLVGATNPTETPVASAGPAPQLIEAPTAPTASPARLEEAETLLAWGRAQYAEQGLQLPEITLVVHPSLEQCGGRVGRYDERTNELVLCRIDQETALHELAHAWIDHNLDTDQRAHFIELRDLPQWNDRTQEWADRGSEQAAEILVWALSDHDRTVSWIESGVETRRLLSIDNSTPEALTAGFQLMTGHQPAKRNTDTPTATAISPEAQRTADNTDTTPFSPELGR